MRGASANLIGMRLLLTLVCLLPLGVVPADPPAARCGAAPVEAEYVMLATASGRDPACRDADRSVWSSARPPGSVCRRARDCAPVCCACPVAGRSALASWCRDGACASPDQACCALLGTKTLSCGNRP
jgi:hypothetical protein